MRVMRARRLAAHKPYKSLLCISRRRYKTADFLCEQTAKIDRREIVKLAGPLLASLLVILDPMDRSEKPLLGRCATVIKPDPVQLFEIRMYPAVD